ncbi:MAG: DAK2 domain-containing protein [Solirubrobacterales bacterium]
MPDPSVERFRRVVESAYGHLESRRQEVNDLNVFPVADGDTGDNMTLTMRAVLAELDRVGNEAGPSADRTEIVSAVARAALMGARGNSGVILSQIVRGAAEELATRPGELVDPVLVASAFSRAADAAYESVRNPAEGTMLTVVRAMAHAATRHLTKLDQETRRLASDHAGDRQDQVLAEVVEAMTVAGERAVKRTTDQLDVLAEAGVVDAGAHGLVLILAGALAGLRGEESGIEVAAQAPARLSVPHHTDSRYRYCVNFIVSGEGLDGEAFVPLLEQLGDSVLVVGDEQTLKVHVHTDGPPAARALFEEVGEVSNVDEADMRAQMAAREDRLSPDREQAISGVVAVASGRGLRDLFEGLGAIVVDGGSTMNPSTDELLAALHSVPAEQVLILPNSPNVVMAAERAVELSERPARVVDCITQQAALAAMVEFDPRSSADEVTSLFEEVLSEVRVGAIAPAARDDRDGRFVRGDAVGFLDGEIGSWGGAGSTLAETISRLADGAELLTVIGGEDAPIPLEEVGSMTPEGIEVELHFGGQRAYWWLLAAQ